MADEVWRSSDDKNRSAKAEHASKAREREKRTQSTKVVRLAQRVLLAVLRLDGEELGRDDSVAVLMEREQGRKRQSQSPPSCTVIYLLRDPNIPGI